MEIAFTEEGHKLVNWEGRTSLIRFEVGLLVALVAFVALFAPSPGALRWWFIGGGSVVMLTVGLYLALTMPILEQGMLERYPEGGVAYRMQRWLFRGQQMAWELSLDNLNVLRVEFCDFEGLGGATYSMARLWVLLNEGEPLLLLDWNDPQKVCALGTVLAKAARRPLEGA
ncbi:MAG: hypothetical protein JW981_11140 [Anaerolineae bacterium]|nr:hypothetical protein [Anaerolineae bacterium]